MEGVKGLYTLKMLQEDNKEYVEVYGIPERIEEGHLIIDGVWYHLQAIKGAIHFKTNERLCMRFFM